MMHLRALPLDALWPHRPKRERPTKTAATREAILYVLRERGPQTFSDLCLALQSGDHGMRDTLALLEARGEVCAVLPKRRVFGRTGRTPRRWHITEIGLLALR